MIRKNIIIVLSLALSLLSSKMALDSYLKKDFETLIAILIALAYIIIPVMVLDISRRSIHEHPVRAWGEILLYFIIYYIILGIIFIPAFSHNERMLDLMFEGALCIMILPALFFYSAWKRDRSKKAPSVNKE